MKDREGGDTAQWLKHLPYKKKNSSDPQDHIIVVGKLSPLLIQASESRNKGSPKQAA